MEELTTVQQVMDYCRDNGIVLAVTLPDNIIVTCSPKTDPHDMRVLSALWGGKDFHEEEAA